MAKTVELRKNLTEESIRDISNNITEYRDKNLITEQLFLERLFVKPEQEIPKVKKVFN